MKFYVLFSFCAIVFSSRAESRNLNNDDRQSPLNNLRRDASNIGREGLSSNNNADDSNLWSNSFRKVARQGNYNNLNNLRSNYNNQYLNNLDSLNQENYNLLLNGLNVGRQGNPDDVNLMSADDYNLLKSAQLYAGRQGNYARSDHLDSEEIPDTQSRFSIGINAGINAGPTYPVYPAYPVQPVAPGYGPVVYG